MIRHPPNAKIIPIAPDELRAEGFEEAGVARAAVADGEGEGVGGVAEGGCEGCAQGVGGDVAGVEEGGAGRVVAEEVGVRDWERVGWDEGGPVVRG